MHCVYCYNSKERAEIKEQSLPLEIAKAGIDEYFANNASRHIRFYGPGEPTMEFERMSEILNYVFKGTNWIKTVAKMSLNYEKI